MLPAWPDGCYDTSCLDLRLLSWRLCLALSRFTTIIAIMTSLVFSVSYFTAAPPLLSLILSLSTNCLAAMVYCGRPSKGCQFCRHRRIKVVTAYSSYFLVVELHLLTLTPVWPTSPRMQSMCKSLNGLPRLPQSTGPDIQRRERRRGPESAEDVRKFESRSHLFRGQACSIIWQVGTILEAKASMYTHNKDRGSFGTYRTRSNGQWCLDSQEPLTAHSGQSKLFPLELIRERKSLWVSARNLQRGPSGW